MEIDAKHLRHRADLPDADPWIRRLGRVGLFSKGTVHVLVGGLAVMAAVGAGRGMVTDNQGVLGWILKQPFGLVLLAAIGIGMLAYAIYRVLGAIKDIDAKGGGAKGCLGRTGFAVTGLVYCALGVSALGVVIGQLTGGKSGSAAGGGGAGGGGSKEQATQTLLNQPYGQWLVGIVGAVVIGYACYQLYKAYSKKFLEKLKTVAMTPKQVKRASKTGTWGIVARSIVLLLTGWFFIQAAVTANSQEAGGIAQAFNTLARQPYGTWLLGAVALGLLLFGIYTYYLARFRHFAKPAGAAS